MGESDLVQANTNYNKIIKKKTLKCDKI